ncbi:hypothetical protein PMIN05_006323, partial [Paraphaeosphaeria minitans]
RSTSSTAKINIIYSQDQHHLQPRSTSSTAKINIIYSQGQHRLQPKTSTPAAMTSHVWPSVLMAPHEDPQRNRLLTFTLGQCVAAPSKHVCHRNTWAIKEQSRSWRGVLYLYSRGPDPVSP